MHRRHRAYHSGAAAAREKDGVLLAAIEERFTRIKHWSGFPAKAIQFCLDEAGITLTRLIMLP
jgi:carbamoyltransferase